MNEESRGGGASTRGDPPIGGYPPPSSTTNERSGASSSTTATSTTSNDLNDLDNLGEGLSLTRLLAGDSSWDQFTDPLNNATPSTHSQQYRPWEADLNTSTTSAASTLDTSTFTTLTTVPTVAPPPNVLAPPPSAMPARPHTFYSQAHHYNTSLPSFQSQFQEVPPPYTGTPPAVPHPHYPLVPPPVQAREIPNIQQQFLDERHIHQGLYGHTHIAQPRPHFPGRGLVATPTARKSQITPSEITQLSTVEAHPTLAAQLRKKTARAGSLEGSESDHSSVDTPGQVAAISSTDPTPETLAGLADAFKPHPSSNSGPAHSQMGVDDPDKPTKKKRKRCGECTGCQKKDNCGECAPCRNDKSHQICKMRRCDKLTEKKPRKPNVSHFLNFLKK